jgi:hypothetical protein
MYMHTPTQMKCYQNNKYIWIAEKMAESSDRFPGFAKTIDEKRLQLNVISTFQKNRLPLRILLHKQSVRLQASEIKISWHACSLLWSVY